ncbi:MAG TPA: hypothetical protein VFB99_16060, partial [Vicinamibacterales bacterium]|nr:hypothetical protein [Vicinamibacterales bacterium]
MKPAFQAAWTITIRLTCSCFGLLALNAAVAEPSPPEILITAETNDNPRLRANDPLIVSDEPASRLIAEARFGFVRSTPRSELAFLPA